MENNAGTIGDFQADAGSDAGAYEHTTQFMEFRLSWVAYLALIRIFIFRFFIFGFLGLGVHYFLSAVQGKQVEWPMLASVGLTILSVIYEYLALRALVLYTNESGVWLKSGVFTWDKGVSGVKWRDVSEATFTTGFFNWALKSYSVRVGHRFTNDAELNLNKVHRGDVAVMHINGLLQRYA